MYSQNDLFNPMESSSEESTSIPFALRRRSPNVYTYSFSNPQGYVSPRRTDGFPARVSKSRPRSEGKIQRDLELRQQEALELQRIREEEDLKLQKIDEERKTSRLKREEEEKEALKFLKLQELRNRVPGISRPRARNFGLRSEEAQLEEAIRLSLQQSENSVQPDSLITTVAKVMSLSPLTKNK